MLLSLFTGGAPLAESQGAPGPSGDRSVWGNFWFQALGLRTSSGIRVDASAALSLPVVFSCVRVLTESFAVMPFMLKRASLDGKSRTDVRNHWLYRLFAKRPNRFQSPYEFRLMLQGHLALRGNAFCQIDANGRGEITELLPLHPDRMTVEMLPSGDYRYRYVDQVGQTHYYTRGEIWHLRGLSSDGIMGMSPLECEREAIGEGLAMQAYASRFFANDAKPGGGWIEYPGQFKTEEAKTKWRESWQNLQGGANRGKVAVLERGMKFHELGLKNSDSQLVEARQFKVADICRIFRVPPHMVAALERATFSNIEQQSIEFWTGTMLPYAELWESSIEFSLLGQGLPGAEDDLEPEFDMDRMMRGDAAARATYYASRTQWGSMTPNEAREREGDEPLTWLNFTMRPANMVKMDADGEVVAPQKAGDTSAPAVPGQPTGRAARLSNARALALSHMARVRTLIEGNAGRMARRIAAGHPTSDDLLAEALALEPDQVTEWRAGPGQALTDPALGEQDIAAALTEFALEA